jgi:hypothetical protein
MSETKTCVERSRNVKLEPVLSEANISKQYRPEQVGIRVTERSQTIRGDMQRTGLRWPLSVAEARWYRVRGKEDLTLKIGSPTIYIKDK